jgi:quinol monooxygenase YgiN
MSENSLRVVARITVRADTVNEVRSLLNELIEPTRKETGCISYELLQNNADPTDFTFVEEWQGDEAIDAHLGTEHIQSVLSRVTGMLAAPPDIRKYSLLA